MAKFHSPLTEEQKQERRILFAWLDKAAYDGIKSLDRLEYNGIMTAIQRKLVPEIVAWRLGFPVPSHPKPKTVIPIEAAEPKIKVQIPLDSWWAGHNVMDLRDDYAKMFRRYPSENAFTTPAELRLGRLGTYYDTTSSILIGLFPDKATDARFVAAVRNVALGPKTKLLLEALPVFADTARAVGVSAAYTPFDVITRTPIGMSTSLPLYFDVIKRYAAAILGLGVEFCAPTAEQK